MNDPKNWRDFEEEGQGGPDLRARITETHLVVFDDREPPAQYELGGIEAVRCGTFSGGRNVVAVEIPGGDRNPGISFRRAENAEALAEALREAVAGARA